MKTTAAYGLLFACVLITAALMPAESYGASRIRPQGNSTSPATNLVAEVLGPKRLVWQHSLKTALLDASANYRLALVMFTSQDCSFCMKMKQEVFRDPDVIPTLANFTLAELDTTQNAEAAQRYGIRGVPTILIMNSNGEVKGSMEGFVPKEMLVRQISMLVNQKLTDEKAAELTKLMSALDSDELAEDKWPDVLAALGIEKTRDELRAKILKVAPNHLPVLVKLLEHNRLVVRLGTAEVLDDINGEDFGFDPWLDAENKLTNQDAIRKWQQWAAGATNATVSHTTISLSREDIENYLQDLVSDRQEKASRARRFLAQSGMATVGMLNDFISAHKDLTDTSRRLLRELKYSMTIPAMQGVEPSATAHRLVFGNQDARIKAVVQLGLAGRRGTPILEEMLSDPDPLVRENVVDALVRSGGISAVSTLEKHAKAEKDRDVLFVMLRALGTTRSVRSLQLLSSYLKNADEDLVLAALGSIGKLETRKATDDLKICLQDPRWRVRVAALQATGNMHLAELYDTVEQLLSDKDDFVRASAVEAIAKMSKKKASTKLQALFRSDDKLKGAVVAALLSLDEPVPESFAQELKGKGPDVLLDVLNGLGKDSKRGLPLIAQMAVHENDDVASTALSMLARMGSAEYCGVLANALRTGNKARQLAVLKSIQSTDGNQIESQSTEDEPDAADPQAKDMADLLDAFGGKPEESSSAPAKTPASEKKNSSDMDDLFESFQPAAASTDQTASATSTTSMVDAAAGGSIADLSGAVKALLKHDDEGIRFNAACALAMLRDVSGIGLISGQIDSLTSEKKEAVLNALSGVAARKEAFSVLKRLLKDDSDSIRRAAASMIIRQPGGSGYDALFDELLTQGTPLKPIEVSGATSSSAKNSSKNMRKWALALMEKDKNPQMQVLGLVLLGRAWKKSDLPAAENMTKSDSPWLRRQAYRLISLKDRETFRKLLPDMLKDTSEFVRFVIPVACSQEGMSWIIYFDSDLFDSEYDSRYGSETRRLSEEEAEALQKLTRDTAANVRLEAFLSLLYARKEVDLTTFTSTVDSFPDAESISARVAYFISRNYRTLGKEFAILLPYTSSSRTTNDSEQKQIRAHFLRLGANIDVDGEVSYTNTIETVKSSYVEAEEEDPAVETNAVTKLVFFSKPGCRDCEATRELLKRIREAFPQLEIEEQNIEKVAAMTINETLCGRFNVPDSLRLVAPAIFTGSGYAIKGDISFARLADLVDKAHGIPTAKWYEVTGADAVASKKEAGKRYDSFSAAVVGWNGLLDGVNPCAFATIIFLISYLKVTRRTSLEILQIGLAFVVAVFMTYYTLGLGLIEIIAKIETFRTIGLLFNWVMAALLFLLIFLNARDGVLCLQGKLTEITLQLPDFLKNRIHTVIRHSARHSRFVMAAFVMGVVVSVLELACTGQTYAPTILFILKSGEAFFGPLGYLLVYNIAFIIPLVIVFALAYSGARDHADYTAFLYRHAAAIKFGTALVFLMMLMWMLFQHGGLVEIMLR